jgi:iron(III) transport system ATP-binding protein
MLRPRTERDASPPMPASPPRLAVEEVSYAYVAGAEVLHRVSFAMEPGEILCLLGPSGCGKTTLLRLVAGLERLQAGRIAIDGRLAAAGAGEGRHVPPERRGVGMVFQDFALFPHLSVADNVAFGVGGPRRRETAIEMLARIGMADYAHAFPHTLSGGQQQRVALARALAPRPLLMLLDEPFSGLDARLRGRLRDDTLHLLKASGVATLMVTHDPEEAMFMADRIAVMDRGRIVQIGRPADLYLRPNSAFVAEFFGEVNRFPATVDGGGAVPTPFGPLPAAAAGAGGGLASGAKVEVLIRPEAVIVVVPGEPDAVPARVIASRMLGRSSLIHLQVESGGGGGGAAAGAAVLHLHARVPGDITPAEGERLAVRLDRRKAYVFPAES